jgi:hypothetical protein
MFSSCPWCKIVLYNPCRLHIDLGMESTEMNNDLGFKIAEENLKTIMVHIKPTISIES